MKLIKAPNHVILVTNAISVETIYHDQSDFETITGSYLYVSPKSRGGPRARRSRAPARAPIMSLHEASNSIHGHNPFCWSGKRTIPTLAGKRTIPALAQALLDCWVRIVKEISGFWTCSFTMHKYIQIKALNQYNKFILAICFQPLHRSMLH